MNTTVQIRVPEVGTRNVRGAAPSLPRVYSGQRMYGALDVSTQNGMEPVFDAAEIVFEGNMTCFIHSALVNEGTSWTVKRQLVHLTDSQPSANFHSACPGIPDNGTVHATFHFDIPETASEPHPGGASKPSLLSAEPTLLPPSTTLRKAYAAGMGPADCGDGKSGICDVTYTIRARLILGDQIIADTIRKVQLVLITNLTLPLDVRDFPDEFYLATASAVAEPLKLKKRGQLSVAVAESAPLIVFLDTPAPTAFTTLSLTFQFRSLFKTAAPLSLPDLTDCTVVSSLEALTHFSVIPQHIALSKQEAKRLPQVAQLEWKAKSQARKLNLSTWQRVADNDANSATWRTTARVVLSPPLLDAPASYMLPTFRTPFVSRRYALALSIKFRSPSAHLAHLSLDLRTPVQVLYASSGGGTSEMESAMQVACGGCHDLTINSFMERPPVYAYL